MKKGLIIIGLAVLAAFLFREGQREGVNNLAGSAIKASGDRAEKMADVESPLPAQPVTVKASVTESASPVESPVPQMKAREVFPDQKLPVPPSIETPTPGALRSNPLFANTTWKIWTGVSAIESKKFDGDRSEIVAQSGGYIIVKDAKMLGDDRNFSASQPLVVFDERMGTVGVVSGRVLLTLKSEKNLAQMEKEYSLKVTDRFDHLKLYFVIAAAQNFDLGKFVYVLKRDPRVANAELEIVSRNYVKN